MSESERQQPGKQADKAGQIPTLAQFDVTWRKAAPDQKRNFYALICETVGTDENAYRRLTEEMIAQELQKTQRNPRIIKLQVLGSIGRSFDSIMDDRTLIDNPEKRATAHAGMLVWLDVIRKIKSEIEDEVAK